MATVFEKKYVPDTEAQRMSDAMGVGFNIGNSLDCSVRPGSNIKGLDIETAWGNIKITRQMIKAIHEGGFKTMRVPVTWHDHVSGPDDKIDPEWLDRVREVVGWCLDEGMFVQLNTHHDVFKNFLEPDDEGFPRAAEYLENVWIQIAEAFKDVSADRLLFESMNEVRVWGASYEWTPDLEDPDCLHAMENINRLNQIFVNTVRKSGGCNADRFLIIPGYSTSTEGCCWDGFRLPEDTVKDRMLVAAHVYSPAHFAFKLDGGEDMTTFDPKDPKSAGPIDERHEKLYEKFVKNGIPVTINEFGAGDKDNDADRARCFAYTMAKAKSLGIQCCYWDNGKIKEYGDGMAIFDRKTCTFIKKEMLDALMS